jgi:hypothetical protein
MAQQYYDVTLNKFSNNNQTHTTIQTPVFLKMDSLIRMDTSMITMRIAPEIIFSNYHDIIKFQTGAVVSIEGTYCSKWGYMADFRLGLVNQEPIAYTSSLQAKSIFTIPVYTQNDATRYLMYIDLRGKVEYRPFSNLHLTAGVDKLVLGEGDRSVIFGGQGISSPYAALNFTYWKFKYDFIHQFWNERTYGNISPKGNATHYLSVKPNKKWTIGLFESVVYDMKDTLYPRGFELEYLNPLSFFRSAEYGLGSADNLVLGINVSYKQKNTVFYGQLLIDDFLLSAYRERNGWWSNKFALQLGIKGNIKRDSSKSFFYRTELNIVKPYMFSHVNKSIVFGNQGMPVSHPLGSNFIELYQEVSYINPIWSYHYWIQFLIKGNDFFSNNPQSSFGGDIYRSYKYRPYEFKNKIGQGSTDHSIQLGMQISKKLSDGYLMSFIEPKIKFTNTEGINYAAFFLSIGVQKQIGADRRNY